jgi:hypothetical protein
MGIDEAIAMLVQEKERGVKHIIISHWTAEQFGRTDDEAWACVCDAAMDADWSGVNDIVDDMTKGGE